MENDWINIGTVVGRQRTKDGIIKERGLRLYVRVINGEKFYAVRGGKGFYHHVEEDINRYFNNIVTSYFVCFDRNETGEETNEPWYFSM